MPNIPVYFFSEGIRFSPLHKKKLRLWLQSAAKKEGYSIQTLNYIFCDDNYLLSINQKYLNHHTLTDIITFDNGGEDPLTENTVEGDIFISYERVKENAKKFGVQAETELKRVMIHGLLHLMGYKDKTLKDKELMRKKEDIYLLKASK